MVFVVFVVAFKPDPRVYRLASEYLGLVPGEIMMVSAHKWDLMAAKRGGLLTAFVPRPFENGPATKVNTLPESYIDVIASDLPQPCRSSIAVETDQPGKDREPRWADHAATDVRFRSRRRPSAEVGADDGNGSFRVFRGASDAHFAVVCLLHYQELSAIAR
ncbi:HAD-IA family hydrolase [Burkholderia gladioli]|uniref:HAD-IA family hydrolase n=1 Tax=Burkholderia gladioli TaxID=28095 RepID=UPI003D36AB4A